MKSGCARLSLPSPPGPRGASHPQPTGGGLMPTPHFLSSAAWDPLHPVERERAAVAVTWRGTALCAAPAPAPALHHRDLGPNPKGSRPCCIPDSPSAHNPAQTSSSAALFSAGPSSSSSSSSSSEEPEMGHWGRAGSSSRDPLWWPSALLQLFKPTLTVPLSPAFPAPPHLPRLLHPPPRRPRRSLLPPQLRSPPPADRRGRCQDGPVPPPTIPAKGKGPEGGVARMGGVGERRAPRKGAGGTVGR